MADYYPLLRKAIERLDRPGEAARYNVYERARQALVRQLRSSGIADEKLDQHLEELDRAVAQIEREFADKRAEPTRVLRTVREQRLQADQDLPRPAPALAEPQQSTEATPVPPASSLRRWGAAMAAA